MADVNSHNAMGYNRVTTTGWRPTCDHGGEPVPAVILDIFAGTGTVGMVAQSLSRRAVLIDLNPEYLVQSLGRNHQVPLGLGS
jgi:16S rRNA G966 N2-methylase RsmD